MKGCDLVIFTSADGVKTRFNAKGSIGFFEDSVLLSYRQEDALTSLHFEGNCVILKRQGDYSMELSLKSGEKTTGKLCFGGNEGELLTKTDAISYTIENKTLKATLQYDLIFGADVQKMQLKILAKFEE